MSNVFTRGDCVKKLIWTRMVINIDVTGGRFTNEPISYDEKIASDIVVSHSALGKEFLPDLIADPACTVLT
jgi:hypothetical protein